MIPIRKGDGTGLSVPGVKQVRTGDGRVLFDAEPAIPDSGDLHAHYDASALSLSDGQSVSTWGDETGNGYDLTAGAAPTYRTSIINGNPVVRFDGVDDYLSVDFTALPQPNTIYIVAQLPTADGSQDDSFYDSNEGSIPNQHLYRNNVGTWNAFAGSQLNDGSIDSNAHIHGVKWDGVNTTIRIDGTEVVSGDAGGQSLDGLIMGANAIIGAFAEMDIGEMLIYPSDKSSIQSDIETYLSNKWGITI